MNNYVAMIVAYVAAIFFYKFLGFLLGGFVYVILVTFFFGYQFVQKREDGQTVSDKLFSILK